MRWSGSSATSGSRLFMSIRSAASCCQPRQEISVPRGARTVRGRAVDVDTSAVEEGVAVVMGAILPPPAWLQPFRTVLTECAGGPALLQQRGGALRQPDGQPP